MLLIPLSVLLLTNITLDFDNLIKLKSCCTAKDSFPCTEDVNSVVTFIYATSVDRDVFSSKLCLIYSSNYPEINISDTSVSELVLNSASLVPKCCPIGFYYDTKTHSCSLLGNEQDFDPSSLPQTPVGLPHCKIITDNKLSSKTTLKTSETKSLLIYDNETLTKEVAFGSYCLERSDNKVRNEVDDNIVLRICESSFDVCGRTRCIHKCCPDNKSFVNGSHCEATYLHGVDLSFSKFIEDENDDDFAIIYGYTGRLYLQPNNWLYSLDNKGVFQCFSEKSGHQLYVPTDETYCIEYATKHGINYGYRLFREYPENVQEIDTKYILNGWAMVVSSFFLIFTIIFYVFSNESRNLFGKTLVSFCLSLLVTFLVLIYSTFGVSIVKSEKKLCHGIGFLLIYMEFSSFLWLKLLCYDIYRTFGTGRIIALENRKKTKLKTFLFYNLYGWGLSLILTGIPLIFFHVNVLPTQFQIQMGIYRCFLDRIDGNYADIIFRTLPISIIQIINISLYVKTMIYCIRVKNDIRKMNDNSNRKKKFLVNKERLGLIIKLAVIMGISYLFEVISSFYDFQKNQITKHVEMVWDIFNCLQGLFIFLIFICKKKHLKSIKNSSSVQKLRRISLTSTTIHTTNNMSSVKKDDKKKTQGLVKR